jgi:hypothetical protein
MGTIHSRTSDALVIGYHLFNLTLQCRKGSCFIRGIKDRRWSKDMHIRRIRPAHGLLDRLGTGLPDCSLCHSRVSITAQGPDSQSQFVLFCTSKKCHFIEVGCTDRYACYGKPRMEFDEILS